MAVPRVFLDSGGGAPVTPRVADALRAGLADGWADPARLHAESRRARALVDGAREAIAEGIGAEASHLWFVGSLDAAMTRAVSGVVAARRGRGRIVTSPIERRALLDASHAVASEGVTWCDVDALGRVDVDGLSTAVADPGVALVALAYANAEIGTVQPWHAIASAAATAQVPLLVDATASIGHADAPDQWDALVADPADWGAPAGLGVVAMRPRTRWLATWPGEDWTPTGFSVPLALAAAVALQERLETQAADAARLRALTERIRAEAATWEGVQVVGDPDERLPHLVTLTFMYLDGEPVVSRLDREGFAVGSGSACGRETFQPSHVLAALGALTHGNVRLGLHPGVTGQDVDRLLAAIPRVMEDVRRTMSA